MEKIEEKIIDRMKEEVIIEKQKIDNKIKKERDIKTKMM